MSYISKYTGQQIDDRLDWAEEAHSWGDHSEAGYLTEGIEDLSGFTTDDLAEGDNLYFTPERVESALPIATTTEPGIVQVGDGLSIDGQGVLTADVQEGGTSLSSTDELEEGVSNLYFTPERVVTAADAEGYLKPDENGELAISAINLPELDNYKVDGVGLSEFLGEGEGDSLPDQTGQGGNTLTTNGTEASWDILDDLTVGFTPEDYTPTEPTLKGHLEGLQAYIKGMIQAINEGDIPASVEILSDESQIETESYTLEVRVASSVGLRESDPVEYSLDEFDQDVNPMTFVETIDGWDHYEASIGLGMGETTIWARATTTQNIETIESVTVIREEFVSYHTLHEDGGPYEDEAGYDSYTADVTVPTFVDGGGPGGHPSQSFDGNTIDDRLLKPYTERDALEIASKRTWVLCVKTDELTDLRVAYGCRTQDSGGGSWWIGVDELGKARCYLSSDSNSEGLEGTSDIADNEWHMVAMVYDGEAGELRIVVDGVTENDAVFTLSEDWASSYDRPIEIGSYFEDYEWPGEICEVAYVYGALTDEELGTYWTNIQNGLLYNGEGEAPVEEGDSGYTDFSEYDVGVYLENQDWTIVDFVASSNFTVIEDENSPGGKAVSITSPHSVIFNTILEWDALNDAEDWEVTFLGMQEDSNDHNWGVAARVVGTEAYLGILRNGGVDNRIGYTDGADTSMTSLDIGPHGVDVTLPFWTRFRVEGNNIYLKSWQDGDPEPSEWVVTVTDSDITTAGKAGLFFRFSNETWVQWSYFGWATDGATAPLPE